MSFFLRATPGISAEAKITWVFKLLNSSIEGKAKIYGSHI